MCGRDDVSADKKAHDGHRCGRDYESVLRRGQVLVQSLVVPSLPVRFVSTVLPIAAHCIEKHLLHFCAVGLARGRVYADEHGKDRSAG